jgi:hypothetical protein
MVENVKKVINDYKLVDGQKNDLKKIKAVTIIETPVKNDHKIVQNASN